MIKKPAAKILSTESAFNGFHDLMVYRLQPRSLRQKGDWTAPIEREIILCNRSALMLIYIPETDELVMGEQFRMGAYLADEDKAFMLECAAGIVDDGEDTESAAIREALEETGCEVTQTEFIGSYFSSPGVTDEEMFMYCGRAAPGIRDGEVFGIEQEGEEVKVHVLPAEEVRQRLDNKEIRHMMSGLALHWFFNNKDRLRQEWLGKNKEAA